MRACFYGTGDQRPGVAGIVQIIMQGFFMTSGTTTEPAKWITASIHR